MRPTVEAQLCGDDGETMAAPHLREYLRVINDAGERSEKYIRCFMPDTSAWLKLDDLNRSTDLFAKAEAAVADDATLAARVRRERLPLEVHHLAFQLVLQAAGEHGLLKGKTVAVDATDLEANASMKSIVRRDTGDDWREYLRKLYEEETGGLAAGRPHPELFMMYPEGLGMESQLSPSRSSPSRSAARLVRVSSSTGQYPSSIQAATRNEPRSSARLGAQAASRRTRPSSTVSSAAARSSISGVSPFSRSS